MSFNVELIKRKMLVKYPFFGSVVANVDYKEDRELSTAGTDGQTIYYNPEFLDKLKPEEQIFIFAHEVCHIAFNHIRRSEGKDLKVWNTATDGVINQLLKQDGLKLVKGSVDIDDAIKYDAEQLYDKLLQEKHQSQGQSNQQNQKRANSQQEQQTSSSPEQGQGQSSSKDLPNQKENESQKEGTSSKESNSSAEQNYDVGHDTHRMWKDAVKKQKETEAKEKKESQANKQQPKEQKQQEKLQPEIDKISKMGEQNAFHKNLEEKKKELESLKKALSKQAMGAGTSTNRDQRIINDIGKSKPIIDWRYVLRDAIQYDVDWSYQNAYVEDGVVRAILEEQPMPETEIVLDTSGSINELLLKNFLRECKNILQHSKVKVGCFDTEFYGFHEIRTEEDIENMRFEGGGGTDFNVAVRAFTRRVENKIIFTDGDADMPNIPMDAIWIVFGGRTINPRGGKVIQINEEQLDKLCSLGPDVNRKEKSR